MRLFDVQRFILLAPSTIVREIWRPPRFYLEATLVTARHSRHRHRHRARRRGADRPVLASSRFLEQAAQPVLIGVLVAPWIAYFTSIVLWLGPADPPVMFLVAFVTTPAFVFATVAGMRSPTPRRARCWHPSTRRRWEVLWRLRLPSALPTILAAARYNIGARPRRGVLRRGRQPVERGARRRRAAGDRHERRGAVGDDPVHGRARGDVPRHPVADRATRPALARLAARPPRMT